MMNNMDFVTCINWTAVSAIASFLMVLATCITLYYNNNQLKELKRQWNEENKACLLFNIISNDNIIYLQIQNAGNKPAYKIHIKIDDSFTNKMLPELHKELMATISKERSMAPRRIIYIPIAGIDKSGKYTTRSLHGDQYSIEALNNNYSILENIPIKITGEYNEKEKINEELTINSFIGSIIIDDPIPKAIKKCNETLNGIYKEIILYRLTIRKED